MSFCIRILPRCLFGVFLVCSSFSFPIMPLSEQSKLKLIAARKKKKIFSQSFFSFFPFAQGESYNILWRNVRKEDWRRMRGKKGRGRRWGRGSKKGRSIDTIHSWTTNPIVRIFYSWRKGRMWWWIKGKSLDWIFLEKNGKVFFFFFFLKLFQLENKEKGGKSEFPTFGSHIFTFLLENPPFTARPGAFLPFKPFPCWPFFSILHSIHRFIGSFIHSSLIFFYFALDHPPNPNSIPPHPLSYPLPPFFFFNLPNHQSHDPRTLPRRGPWNFHSSFVSHSWL